MPKQNFMSKPNRPPVLDQRHIDPASEDGQIQGFILATNFVTALADLHADPKGVQQIKDYLLEIQAKSDEVKQGIAELNNGYAKLNAYREELVASHDKAQNEYDQSVQSIEDDRAAMVVKFNADCKAAQVKIEENNAVALEKIKDQQDAVDKADEDLKLRKRNLATDEAAFDKKFKELDDREASLDDRNSKLQSWSDQLEKRFEEVSALEKAAITDKG